MLEILQFYVSSFPVWLGITIGIAIVCQGVIGIAAALRGPR